MAKGKRLLAFLLVLIMAVSLVSVSAFAHGQKPPQSSQPPQLPPSPPPVVNKVSYNVSYYDIDGNELKSDTTERVDEGKAASYTILSFEDAARNKQPATFETGYEFGGWCFDDSVYSAGSYVQVSNNMELKAVPKLKTNTMHYVIGSQEPIDIAYDVLIDDEGNIDTSNVKLASLEDLKTKVADGYSLVGWTVQEDNSNTVYAVGSENVFAKDTTFVAVLDKDVVITGVNKDAINMDNKKPDTMGQLKRGQAAYDNELKVIFAYKNLKDNKVDYINPNITLTVDENLAMADIFGNKGKSGYTYNRSYFYWNTNIAEVTSLAGFIAEGEKDVNDRDYEGSNILYAHDGSTYAYDPKGVLFVEFISDIEFISVNDGNETLGTITNAVTKHCLNETVPGSVKVFFEIVTGEDENGNTTYEYNNLFDKDKNSRVTYAINGTAVTVKDHLKKLTSGSTNGVSVCDLFKTISIGTKTYTVSGAYYFAGNTGEKVYVNTFSYKDGKLYADGKEFDNKQILVITSGKQLKVTYLDPLADGDDKTFETTNFVAGTAPGRITKVPTHDGWKFDHWEYKVVEVVLEVTPQVLADEDSASSKVFTGEDVAYEDITVEAVYTEVVSEGDPDNNPVPLGPINTSTERYFSRS